MCLGGNKKIVGMDCIWPWPCGIGAPRETEPGGQGSLVLGIKGVGKLIIMGALAVRGEVERISAPDPSAAASCNGRS